MVKAIISDLDGTLLDKQHRITNYTRSIFHELHARDYLLIVATGRHHVDASSILEDIGLPLYLITSNGAHIHDPNGQLLYSNVIKENHVSTLLNMNSDELVYSNVYTDKQWFVDKANDKMLEFHAISEFNYQISDFSTFTPSNTSKVFFTCEEHGRLLELEQEIKRQFSNNFNLTFSLPECLEIMNAEIDKSSAIQKVLSMEGVSLEESIAFGDGYNDKRMLDIVGQGLIMGNAVDSLKHELSHLEVIGNNDQNSVASYLDHNILTEKIA